MARLYGLMGGVAIALGLASHLVAAAPAKAGLKFCNKSNQGTVYIALAYPADETSWTTKGWLTLEQGKCGNFIEDKLTNRYFYYFAESDKDYSWKGTHPFCVSSKRFNFANASKQCKGELSRWEKFRELDTGKNIVDYTLNLE